MPIIEINGTVINFPNTGTSPEWSEAVDQFAVAVEEALSGLISTGDVSKQFFPLDSSHNPAVDITLIGLSFSTAVVRAAFIRYSVFRQTDTNSAYEVGEMDIIYNPNNSTGQKWEIQRQYTSDASITFTVDDSGQFSFSTAAIPGANHTGKIAFVAQSLAQ